jgi:hypothetical protein
VNALQKVMTEGIWVAGHKESFTASNVAVDVPDPKVDLREPLVNVNVEIGERRVEKTFAGVSVSTADGGKVQPATTTVTVLGVASLINSLKAEEVKIVLDNDLKPQLEVPDALKGKVTLKSVQTSKFISLK